ncbi:MULTISPECIES: recombination mediator RecR [Chromobacterium]|uniref:Recombination protein RecR n=2 Tax=Chromobacterium TaxID=535 RepID=A0A1W0CBM1_9NEIS|nr:MULTISPECIES: recombination mediator RecR [Chromobacterium]AXT45750.1 recombination protein RecR [Chromobacterium rhizoryzae]MBK0413853.1 recombination protein RecR [Chromobacterium haemolyticum]MBO0415460.1 recombination protein RecR [Chromobacterium haemolyticum]MBO0498721.1 recombination protein RecR [Chromobacterium haemolyticum]MDH0340796.1 recombination mediator RecR [Chromobacterium haemolyticum]
MKNPPALDHLISALKVLPGVGPKTAQRMAFHLLQRDKKGADKLARALDRALTQLTHCERCNTFSETPLCPICADEERRQDLLCVVEMPADLLTLEQAKCFDGLYFVLMGRISPLDNVGPRDINLDKLLVRAADSAVQEVIIATNFTAEGEVTAHMIAELLKERGLKVTRIARGMPVGGELEYVDLGTLAQAVYERRGIGQ